MFQKQRNILATIPQRRNLDMQYIQTYPTCDAQTGALLYVGNMRLENRAICINKEGDRFVEEMERRYDLLANMGVRDITTFNEKVGKQMAKLEADMAPGFRFENRAYTYFYNNSTFTAADTTVDSGTVYTASGIGATKRTAAPGLPGYAKLNEDLESQGQRPIFRISHMGDITPAMLQGYLDALGQTLTRQS